MSIQSKKSTSKAKQKASVKKAENPFDDSYTLEPEGRRLYTRPNEKAKKPNPDSLFHTELGKREKKKQDFSYADLEDLKEKALSRKKLMPDFINQSVQKGLDLDKGNGVLLPDPELDPNLQLLSSHLVGYQEFNAPELKRKDEKSLAENEYREHEMEKTKTFLGHNFSDTHQQLVPPTPKEDGQILTENMFSPLMDINRQQPKSIFENETSKAVFTIGKKVFKSSFEKAKASKRKTKEQEKQEKKRSKQESQDSSEPNLLLDARFHFNSSLMEELALMENSKIKDEKDSEKYLKDVFQVDYDSDDSLKFDSSDEETEPVPKIVYDEDDTIEDAQNKRATYLNTGGLLAKVSSQKEMIDRIHKRPVQKFTPNRKRLNRKLQKKQDKVGMPFNLLYSEKQYQSGKQKLINKLAKEHGNKKEAKKLEQDMNQFYEQESVRSILDEKEQSVQWKRKHPAFENLGEKSIIKALKKESNSNAASDSNENSSDAGESSDGE